MIEVEVEDEAWRTVPDVEARARIAAEATLAGRDPPSSAEAQSAAAPLDRPSSGREAVTVSILLTDDATVCDLNARFRGRDQPTNVLSFPAPPSALPHLGDIALAQGVCTREAEAQAKTLGDHLSHLVVHGVLHLLGHDHEGDAEAEAMERRERIILAGLGIEDPYRQDMHVRS